MFTDKCGFIFNDYFKVETAITTQYRNNYSSKYLHFITSWIPSCLPSRNNPSLRKCFPKKLASKKFLFSFYLYKKTSR